MDCLNLIGSCSELDCRVSNIEKVIHQGTIFSYVAIKSLDELPKDPNINEQHSAYILGEKLYLYVGKDKGDSGYQNQYIESGSLNGVGIEKIIQEPSQEAGGINKITIYLTDGTSYDVTTQNGDNAKYITKEIIKQDYDPNLDRTYTIYGLTFYNTSGERIKIKDEEGDVYRLEFKVYDGRDGSDVITTTGGFDVSNIAFHSDEVGDILEVGNATIDDLVRYDVKQSNPSDRKKIARENIDAASAEEYSALQDRVSHIEEIIDDIPSGGGDTAEYTVKTVLVDETATLRQYKVVLYKNGDVVDDMIDNVTIDVPLTIDTDIIQQLQAEIEELRKEIDSNVLGLELNQETGDIIATTGTESPYDIHMDEDTGEIDIEYEI